MIGDRVVEALRRDEGAGTVLSLALAAALLSCSLAAATAGAAFVVRQRTVAAADAAALAAADVRLGVVAGVPCEAAERVAAAHGAALSSCALDGATATVTVGATVLGIPIAITSRAGAAGEEG